MASVQLQNPFEQPQAQAQAPTLPLPANHTQSKPSEQQASIQTSQKSEEKNVGSNIMEGVKELLHIEQSSKKTDHATQVEKSSTGAKEGETGVIVVEKKKKDKKEKDKKEKDKHAKNNENGQVAMIGKSPKTHEKKEKKEKKKNKNKNKDDDSSSSSDDNAHSKAKKLDKEKKKHK